MNKTFRTKDEFIISAFNRFVYYKSLADKSIGQLTEKQLFIYPSEDSNNIAVIVKHLAGNMKSRWADFLTTDGEKAWRNRDSEFANDIKSKSELLKYWEEGWAVLFNTLRELSDEDLSKKVYIRNEAHSIIEAINRQLTHYAYHVGQIVFIAKWLKGTNWTSLSIPKGQSDIFNDKMFQIK